MKKRNLDSFGELGLQARKLSTADLAFWLDLYREPDAQAQMYAAPTSTKEELWRYLSERETYTVWKGEERLGGFTLTKEKQFLATFGIVIHKTYRNQGFGRAVFQLLENTASGLGFRTLRADVYSDNEASIRLLKERGFREFIWLEKNL